MKVVIVGAGGHGAVVADIVLRMHECGERILPVAFADDSPRAGWQAAFSLPVLPGGLTALRSIDYDAVIVAIGNNAVRRRLVEDLSRDGRRLAIARHPSSVVAPSADVAAGTVICAGAVIGAGARIGTAAILNTHCSVDHHNAIGNFVHVAPGAHLGGEVSVGDDTLLGIGTLVLPGRRIGRRAVIGAGSVVVRDLPDDIVAMGAPARARTLTEPVPVLATVSLGHADVPITPR